MSGGINNEADSSPASTEDEILNSIEDISGESFDDPEETEETDEDEDAAEEQSADDEASEQTEEPPVQRADNRRPEPRQRRIPQRRGTEYDYDKDGNVIDLQSGKVLYAMGTPARDLFAELQDTRFKAKNIEREFANVVNEGRKLEQLVEQYRRAPSVGDQLKLSTEDQVLAFQHMAAFRQDPVKGIRAMLHQFQLDGGDLTDIFDNLEKIQLEGLEARLGKQVDAITKPQRDAAAEQARLQEVQQRAAAEIQTFFRANPDAEQHAPLLAHVINRAAESGQQMNLTQAWVSVLKFAQARGLDLNGNLQAQLSAPPRREQRVQRPMPNGRASTAGMRSRDSAVPSYDRRSRDIVAEAMREAGFTV